MEDGEEQKRGIERNGEVQRYVRWIGGKHVEPLSQYGVVLVVVFVVF